MPKISVYKVSPLDTSAEPEDEPENYGDVGGADKLWQKKTCFNRTRRTGRNQRRS